MSVSSFCATRWLVVSLLLAVGCGRAPVVGQPATQPAATPARQPAPPPDPSTEFFNGPIRHLELTLKPEDAEKINQEGRPYVHGTLVEKDAEGKELAKYKKVSVKLKGAAGSFQQFGDKPALTLRPDKSIKGQRFHGLAKFHLNNSVQDETYLQEQLCSELFAQAGIPAARATHARVWLNGRDVGLYVLKEGFDKVFLARHFANANGNLYDGGFCTDIDVDLEKDSGTGPDDFSDLVALREAAAIAEPSERWRRLEELIEIDRFLTFVALELMTQHWDGYAQSKNNYRLYFDPQSHRAHFFPHGMDQMFGDPNASIVHIPDAILCRAVLDNSAWRERFKSRVNELLPLFAPDKLAVRADTLYERLRPALLGVGEEFASQRAEHFRGFRERLVARAESLDAQKSFPDPPPEPEPLLVEFDEQGEAALEDWQPASEVEAATVEEFDFDGTTPAFRIACGPADRCIASWRKGVRLAAGRYRFVARARTTAVVPIENDDRGVGAGLRISGSPRENQLVETTDWTALAFEFEIDTETRDIVLVAELRATAGEVAFERSSLRLVRLP